MKVMLGYGRTDRIEEKGKWPCVVSKKGVGNKLILSTSLLEMVK